MSKSFKSLFLASLTAFALVGLSIAPIAEAARSGGGGARASTGARSGGGAGRQQINNSNRDMRTNNVRNSSVNNVNSSRNVNRNVSRDVNVKVDVDDYHGGCCHNGWDDDYHPVATAAAIAGTAAIIGSMVNSVPANCVPVNVGGVVYQQCGSTWYQPQGSQFVVVNPPY